jgi:hypothetical protein
MVLRLASLWPALALARDLVEACPPGQECALGGEQDEAGLLQSGAKMSAALGSSAVAPVEAAPSVPQVSEPWSGSSCSDLGREYDNIFRHGNRNAASHLWSWFLMERSEQMNPEKFVDMFRCFCAVSGSPTEPSDTNRYKLMLPKVDGSGSYAGFMHFCCPPCVCDAHDLLKVDTKTIKTAEGERTYHFAVLGNPCEHPEELNEPFQDGVSQQNITLTLAAPELSCDEDGTLHRAPISDNGHIIIGMLFDFPDDADPTWNFDEPVPGRVVSKGGVSYQDEAEYSSMCQQRAADGYNSGMGEIFRRVARITPISVNSTTF